ncbi:MAG: PD-(D/E)XK nuclease family protein [Gemmatimonadota bacterium]|nr:PD-(D/E)XK nuclease family protein [Gemmatimonadota bacterium]
MSLPRIVVSSRSSVRRRAALRWLREAGGGGALVVGETLTGPHDLILEAVSAAGPTLGWRRVTLSILATELAAARLGDRVPAGGVARDAVVARTLMRLGPEALGRLGPVSDTPGFIRAVGGALEELRLAGVEPEELGRHDEGLAALAAEVDHEWEAAGLADRATVMAAAAEAVQDAEFRHYLLDLPTLFYDLRVDSRAVAGFASALLERAPESLVTFPAGDERTPALLELTAEGEGKDAVTRRALDRLQEHLFDAPPDDANPDETLTVFSAPGEGRECVEIARRLLRAAEEGRGFDRAAVLLRQPQDYRPYVEEALRRADIPAYFARGVRRPDPAGRAFLALLRCRAEDYSAARFAEYLSVGEVPDATEEKTPPSPPPPEERWVPADEEGESEVVEQLGFDLAPVAEDVADESGGVSATARVEPSESGGPVRARNLRVPRRWEKLLVESSVVGGLDRWRRRLASLREELEIKRDGLAVEDAEDPRVTRVDGALSDLRHFREYALPLLDELAALPETGTWAEWIDALGGLASRSIRHPEGIHATLSALGPMGPVGPVRLAEVVQTLGPRLIEAASPSKGNRYGKVFVGPIDAARGHEFDVVFVPGMAERVFPPKIAEDPILLDDVRDALNAGPRTPGLRTNAERVADERLALTIAVGAAREQVVLSYPRIEAGKSRPRVPSFYMLEAVRAAEGRLPRFEDLAERAEKVSDARIGWPAPRVAASAIDEAEYDLAVLADLGVRGDAAVKAAGHLLHTNRHLARALRFRAYRWEVRRWTWADGLLQLSPGATEALARHAPDARAFSATALQHFAACPYRFYLYTIQGLAPREEPVGIESLDPLQRGSLVHQIQFELLTRLQIDSETAVRAGGTALLPVTPENLESAHSTLDDVVEKVAGDFRDRLVPAIDRVWRDGIEAIRQDLREWLHRESLEIGPFEPHRFELSFGLPRDADRDEHSVPEPVDLGVGLRLRGAIDLIERTASGVVRVTDHKTGRYRPRRNAIIQGGELLQPVLYGLAAQQLFPEDDVQSGRLYYCTSDGEFRSHEVPINEETAGAARVLADVLGSAYEAGAFQALPRKKACDWCDYRTVCGPDEERRILRKPAAVELKRLRDYQ